MRKRITYANVTATLALVFAMSGGAFAAKHYLLSSTKQISPKVLRSLKGKTGQTGATGPAGLAGLAGKEGKEGKEGKQGIEGKEGKEGPPGPVNLSKLTEVRGEPAKITEGKTGGSSAFCAEGFIAVSGGYFLKKGELLETQNEAFNFEFELFEILFHFTGWSASGFNPSGFPEAEIEAIAYCAKEGSAVQARPVPHSQRALAQRQAAAKLAQKAAARTR